MKVTSVLAVSAATIPLIVTLATTTETITRWVIPPNPTQLPAVSYPDFSPTLHAIGKGADGLTTYVEEYEVSVAVWFLPIQTDSDGAFVRSTPFGTSTTTLTAPSGPTTLSFTFAADATHYVHHHEPSPSGNPQEQSGEDQDCVFDGKGSASCVDKFWLDSYTTTRTWTTSATTIHTAVVVDDKNNNAAPGAGFGKEPCIAWGISVVGVLSAWILLL